MTTAHTHTATPAVGRTHMLWKPTLKFFSGDSTALGIGVGAATVWSYTMSGEPPYRPPAPMCCSPTPDMSRSQKCLYRNHNV